jgi:hypothetical protein
MPSSTSMTRIQAARRAALCVAFGLAAGACANVAHADMIGLPPENGTCPDGTRQTSSHGPSVVYCLTNDCAAPSECDTDAGVSCESRMFCMAGGYPMMSCDYGEVCPHGTCSAEMVCAHPLAPPPDTESDGGCQLRDGQAPVALGALLGAGLVGWTLRRRRPR